MKPFSAIALIFAVFLALTAAAEDESSWEVQALSRLIPGTTEGKIDYDLANGTARGTNGVYIKYGIAALTADSAVLNMKTGDVEADGNVRIEAGEGLWVGDHVHYNFKTRMLQTDQFRMGKPPFYVSGTGLSGNTSNRVYTAQSASVTTDDVSDPAYQIHASRVRIVPGKSIEMWNAIFYMADMPMFYYPYYQRNIGHLANNWTVMPGYKSQFGGYVLGTYRWYLGDELDGKLHADYRAKRGVGLGPDMNGHLGEWGDFNLRYYYTHDQRPNSSTNAFPQFGSIPENRQRFKFEWQATPATNLNVKSLVNYQSDPLVLHDFFPGDYSANPQPSTFVEGNKYWDNWSLDALTTPRINSFFTQVERLPDVRLTGYRQQVLDTPVYYDSQSSMGWFRLWEPFTNGVYKATNGFYVNSATRGDTYHQLTLPWTFFNWLNVTPRVGGRLTYYSSQNLTNGQPNDETTREIFNTGIGTSFKASRLWAGATNSILEVDGLRHIIEPSANYVYVPNPSVPPTKLPQFDAEQPSLLLLPDTFPDYNNIDSIDTQNAIRFGLRNTLQTKRDGRLDDLLSWNMLIDWRLDPKNGQKNFNDLYSAVAFRPRSWLTAESQTRYDLNYGQLNLALEQLTFAPSDRWSWGIGYWYLRGGDWGNNPDWTQNNTLTSTIFYRFGDNWGARVTDNYNIVTQRLQEQFYTLYRDFRSWTASLTLRVNNETGQSANYTVAFMVSLKANPAVGVGEDIVNRYRLVGE
jgi:lipopolysaccharide assembly outer membrane protein LptD (OstA)